MTAYRRIPYLFAAALALVAGAPPASAQSQRPTLVVFPNAAHYGDTVYISGGNFPKAPKGKPYSLPVIMYCPSVINPTQGEAAYLVKVGTDGSFVARPFEIYTLPPGATGHCEFRAQTQTDPIGAHADFTILPKGAPVSKRYGLSVRVSQSTSKSSSSEIINVKPFIPGATLHFKERFAGAKPIQYATQLPWSGSMTLRREIPDYLDHSTRVHMDVVGRFHDYYGVASVNFVLRR